MEWKPSRVLSARYIADFLVDHRLFVLILVAVVTILLGAAAPGLQADLSLKSILVTDAPECLEYEKFVETFGSNEFITVAIKNREPAGDETVIRALEAITKQLSELDKISEVISPTNLNIVQKRGQRLGNYPFMRSSDGVLRLPPTEDLDTMRKAAPVINFVLSPDLKTVGVLIRVKDQWKFGFEAVQELLTSIDNVVRRNQPEGSDHRIVGPAIIRQAALLYSLRSAIMFGLLCTLICVAVSILVFKSAKVTAATAVILALGVLWVIGVMSILKVPLQAATSITFGMIMIATTLEIVIHFLIRYNQFRLLAQDRIEALKETVRFLVRPCLICSATTAVGYGAIMVSSIPMIFQLGLIMSLGIGIAFLLAVALMTIFIAYAKFLDKAPVNATIVGEGASSGIVTRAEMSIRNHHRLYVIAGIAFSAIMFAGTPFIRTDSQILHQFKDSSPEIKDLKFVAENLTAVHSLELMLESEPGVFKKSAAWAKVAELEKKLIEIPDVIRIDSLMPFLQYMHSLVQNEAIRVDDLFRNPNVIPELLLVTSMSRDGQRMARQYLDEGFERLRVTVWIKNSRSIPIGETIEKVRSNANTVMGGIAKPIVTGELAMLAAESDDIVRSEFYSIILALVMITVLLMIQMGTPLFGLISLLPNIPPIAAVFGIMGWLHIPLDAVTIFAATIAIGLAADNTIHYVAQLKRQMKLNPGVSIEQCIFGAYRLAARPMASWSIVTLVGFLALLVTPFRATVNLGLLVASSVLMGMFGDLIFMQSMILTFPAVKRLIANVIAKEISGQETANSLDPTAG